MTLAHWDDVPEHRNAKGPMDATWQFLCDAAGGRGIGVNRVRVAPGRLPTPPHSHSLSEEIFVVLSGSGLLWQDAEVCEVGAGDVVVQEADHYEHTFRAGGDGLEYLVFGTRHPTEYGWLPRSRAVRMGYVWAEGRVDDPWDVETEVGELEFAAPGPRPDNVRRLEEYELDEDGDRVLAPQLQRSGLNWIDRPAGKRGAIPHCHSLEPEAFVVLAGSGTLELWSRKAEILESHELRPGHIVARPAATGVSHSIVAGPAGVTYLAYGPREPGDMCFYPRSQKIAFAGVPVIMRIEQLDYWDGESLTE